MSSNVRHASQADSRMPGPSSLWTRMAAPMILSVMALSRAVSEVVTIPHGIARSGAACNKLVSGEIARRITEDAPTCLKKVPQRALRALRSLQSGAPGKARSGPLGERLPVRHQLLDRIAAEFFDGRVGENDRDHC